ncbi:hypothetical protein Bbelb_019120 [Branchiostoma belcheri]|nr:hypothetical protein Bbelb_019120 [Branchiostoma belcheri]
MSGHVTNPSYFISFVKPAPAKVACGLAPVDPAIFCDSGGGSIILLPSTAIERPLYSNDVISNKIRGFGGFDLHSSGVGLLGPNLTIVKQNSRVGYLEVADSRRNTVATPNAITTQTTSGNQPAEASLPAAGDLPPRAERECDLAAALQQPLPPDRASRHLEDSDSSLGIQFRVVGTGAGSPGTERRDAVGQGDRAFDTIDHGSLLHSLAGMGIRRDLWSCVRSYLSDRVQRVRWDSRISAPRPVLAGTPQGGIISPSLFVLAMNSLDNNIPQSVTHVKYADDLTNSELLMGSLPGQMQVAINEVDTWAKSYSMAANVGKTKDMVISCRRESVIPPPLTLNGETIERVPAFKLLGVIVSNDLSWGAHVEYMLSKERRREASVRELRRVMADETHRCQQFLEPGRRTTYQLRRQTSSYKIPLSHTERHRQSFIPRSLNILQQ